MRANDFLNEWNLFKPKDHGRAHRDGLDLEYFIGPQQGHNSITINAKSAGGKVLGQVLCKIQPFVSDKERKPMLYPLDLWVDEEVRGQGIAAIIYDWAKELGYVVQRSGEQTDAGARSEEHTSELQSH